MPIRIDTRDAQRAVRTMARRLSTEQVARATARAINHTLGKTNTVAKRAILQRYNLHKSQVMGKRLKVKRAYPRKLEGKLDAHRQPIPLISFIGTHRTGKGVMATVVKGEKKLVRSAFITTTKKGRRGVFARGEHTGTQFQFRHKRIARTGPDLPIEELYSVSVFSAGEAQPVQLAMRRIVDSSYTARLLKEMQNIANGITV